MEYYSLEFGNGDRPPRENFLGVDIRKTEHVTFVCNAWEIGNYVEPESIHEIYSRHFFEHLTFKQADLTLAAWQKVLKPLGKLQIILPDLQYHIDQYCKGEERAKAWVGLWGEQREGETELWDVHKSGYDFESLKEKLEAFQFRSVERLKDAPKNLNVICVRYPG